MLNEINPFDILSGKVAKSYIGTFWFKEAGNNMQGNGWPIFANLHRPGRLPAAMYTGGAMEWYHNGKMVKYTNGNAIIYK